MSKTKTKTLVFTDTDKGGIIHVANIKGGVGKSTVATNLAAAFSKKGPTLIVDLDVQGSATYALGMDPAEFSVSSWQLFSQRFAPENTRPFSHNLVNNASTFIRKTESFLFPQIVGNNKQISSLAIHIQSHLDLIPASSDLFKNVYFYHLENLVYNLNLCKDYYKYIVIDTPSVWNKITRLLYISSDLNLIPVTLHALSTKSLQDYLNHIKKLTLQKPSIRVRVIKNEVYGKKNSAIKGKTRTMKENREFLESLCEQVAIANATGVSLLPQSIIFDIEIPESATICDAQDKGQSVLDFHQYSSVAKAFDSLAKHVQYVLNNPVKHISNARKFLTSNAFIWTARTCIILLFIAVVFSNSPVSSISPPRPIAPQQIVDDETQVLRHTFTSGESLTRIAKYAICYFRAIVPSNRELIEYVNETVELHNMTRMPGEDKISSRNFIPEGTVISFFPPSRIHNPNEKLLVPVYRYFVQLTNDSFAYITGDWCERGNGGGTPHYGIDVATALGAEIISPISGTAILRDSQSGGRMVAVVRDDMVLFFAHLARRSVRTGDEVKKGDVIGTVGMTGVTSGPHVHIGYGIYSVSGSGVIFGRRRYRLVDPKLFFYREQYMQNNGIEEING